MQDFKTTPQTAESINHQSGVGSHSFTPMEPLIRVPEDAGVREALELLSRMGYEIYHKGAKLVRQGGCWSWIKQ